MGKARTLLIVGLAALTVSLGHAATLVNTDFTKNADGWTLNETAKLEKLEGDARGQYLSLTQNEGSQTGTAWTNMAFKVPSFSYIADIRIRFTPPEDGACPADGAAMAFANTPADTVGGGGGGIGLFGGAIEQFSAFEINTWRNAGVGTDDERGVCTNESTGFGESFAIDVLNANIEDTGRDQDGVVGDPKKGGDKLGQIIPPKGMRIVNGGMFRYQWNVTEDGNDNLNQVFVTGLDDTNKQFMKVKVLEVRVPKTLNETNFEGRFGLTAATGGAVQFTEIAAVRIESPAVEPQ